MEPVCIRQVHTFEPVWIISHAKFTKKFNIISSIMGSFGCKGTAILLLFYIAFVFIKLLFIGLNCWSLSGA